jgi:hypothetical protein
MELRNYRMTVLISIFLLATAVAAGEESDVFLSYHAEKDVEPGADPNSDFWKGIHGVFIEKNITGSVVRKVPSEVRSRWTNGNLYFLLIAPYENLNLKPNPVTTTQTIQLWRYDVFEVYIGSDFENIHLYKELQMSPQSEYVNLDVNSITQKRGEWGNWDWDSGMRVMARIDEAKKIWYGEMRVPFPALDRRPPRSGNELRVNLFRSDGTPPKRDFLAWRPTDSGGPHQPKYFGVMQLVKGQ